MSGKQKKKQNPSLDPAEIERQAHALAEPITKEAGLELVDTAFLKESSQWILRLIIDREGGVDLDDCATVSRALSAILDEALPITAAYTLEVSSPGLERPLKRPEDFERFRGSPVQVNTREPLAGYTAFAGYLLGMEGSAIALEHEGQRMNIPYELMDNAHLIYDFSAEREDNNEH
jgi:ribosome maturation factor RimP